MSGRRGGIACPLGFIGLPGDVVGTGAPCGPWGRVGPVGPVCLLWGRRRSPNLHLAAVGAWPAPKVHLVAVGACPTPLTQSGCRGGVAGPLGPVCRSGGVAILWAPLGGRAGRGRSPGPRHAAMKAWPVSWASSGCREGLASPRATSGCHGSVAGALGRVWPPWGRGQFPGPRLAAVGAWPIP